MVQSSLFMKIKPSYVPTAAPSMTGVQEQMETDTSNPNCGLKPIRNCWRPSDENLKRSRAMKKEICPECHGNGYVGDLDGEQRVYRDCHVCDSQGEIPENEMGDE